MDELDIVKSLVVCIIIFLVGLLIGMPIFNSGYQEGLCHGKHGTGSTYTNGECFIPIK